MSKQPATGRTQGAVPSTKQALAQPGRPDSGDTSELPHAPSAVGILGWAGGWDGAAWVRLMLTPGTPWAPQSSSELR